MSDHHLIHYIEIPSRDLGATKSFFESVFGFVFTDYGPEYSSFDKRGVYGGFFLADAVADTAKGSVLTVLYSDDIEQSQDAVMAAGGTISKPVFDFPGGRRFHFVEPGGSDLAVWTEAS